MILLIRTDMSGTIITTPEVIDRSGIPQSGSFLPILGSDKKYQHVVNHSYSADDSRPLFKGMIHAIYTMED